MFRYRSTFSAMRERVKMSFCGVKSASGFFFCRFSSLRMALRASLGW